MESLIIIIILALISTLGNGKKRNSGRPRARAGRQMQTMRDIAQQMIGEVIGVDDSAARQEAGRRRRAENRQPRSQEAECGYCTGEIAVEANLPHHAPAMVKEPETPCVDVAALQKQWGLSDLQNALLWQEILDKPLAARRRGIR